jgi:signal peptidase II
MRRINILGNRLAALSAAQKARLCAAAAIMASLASDIAVKRLFLVETAQWNFRNVVPGLLDTHYTWNRGVSFSLFWQNSDLGSAALAALLTGIIIALAILAFRTSAPLVATGMGFIVGGALGNIVDRATQGAVFDFLVVRFGTWPLFVCNSADLFISLGVILLGVDMLFFEDARKA